MNSVILVRSLLMARPELVAMLAAGNSSITAGIVDESTPLPALGVSEVSSVDRVLLAGGITTRVTSIVQVTVVATNYRQGKDVLAQVKFALRNFVGTAPTSPPTLAVTCHLEGTGPDFESTSGFVAQTQDVTVTFEDAL